MKTTLKFTIFSILISIVFTACGGGGASSSTQAEPKTQTSFTGDGNIETLISETLEKYDIPAMAVLTVSEDLVLEKAVFGKKVSNQEEVVTLDDKWNIGSVTKSMTSTLSALLVDKGFLSWDTTLVELFPEFESYMQDKYKDVTLVELLSHTAGLPEDSDELWQEYVDDEDDLITQRYEFTYEALVYENENSKGTYLYSNINYVVVASILEKVSGLSFEELIKTYLFDELNMTNTQVGTSNLNSNVQGHVKQGNTWIVKSSSEINSDNVSIVAPAGSQTFISIDDMAKYLQVHLKAKLGMQTTLMNSENFNKLHEKVVMADSDLGYALGWFTESDYGLQHSGSNGRWYSLAFVNSQKKYAYFVTINAYTQGVEQAVYEMMQTLVKRSDALNDL